MKAAIFAFFFCAVAAGSGCVALSQTATASAAPSASASPDAEYQRFIGKWDCSTAVGSTVKMVFAPVSDGDLGLHIDWSNDSASGWWAATFHHDPSNGSWTTSNTGSNGWTYSGRSPGFNGWVLQFDGIQKTGQGDVPTREIFTILANGDLFQHQWQTQTDTSWQNTSFAVCDRAD